MKTSWITKTTSGSEPESGFGTSPASPACDQNNVLPADCVHRASNCVVHAKIERGQSGNSMSSKLRPDHWGMFAGGHLISGAVIVSVMSQLLFVCFYDYAGDDVSGATQNVDGKVQGSTTIPTKDTVMFTLTFGLIVDVLFAVLLSVVYRVPLDIKSVHHIPLEALLSCGEYFTVFVLAPFSWASIYLLGGTASRYLSLDLRCEEQGGSGLGLYLTISGMSMTLVGVILLGISLMGLCSSLGSPVKRKDGFGASVCTIISQHMLSTGVVLDIGWQLQAVIWSYRTGGFGLAMVFLVGTCSMLGALLPSIGFLLPDEQDAVTA